MPEKPTIEEPKKVEGKEEEKDLGKDTQELLKELDSLGIGSPEKIRKVHETSQQYGKTAMLLGEANEQLREMKQAMADVKRMQQQASAPRRMRQDDDYSEGNRGASVDLEEVVGKVVRKEVAGFWNEKSREQQMIYQQRAKEIAIIKEDPDYTAVEKVFEARVSNPDVQMMINSGQTTLEREFNKISRSYYRKLAENARDVVTGLTETTKRRTPPHMEGGEQGVTPRTPEEDERGAKLKKIREEGSGSDEDIEKMLDEILPPAGDAFYGNR